MANISKLSQLIGGIQRQVDLSVNTLVVGALSTGTNTLTDTILGRLLSLQNGSDVDATYHTHNTIYFTKTQLGSSTGGTAGSTLIGDNNSYTNFTNGDLTLKGALAGIDSALGSSTASSAFDGTFRIKNTLDNTKQIAFDASGITASTTRTITMPDADVNLGQVNTSIQQDGSRAFAAAQSMGGFKLTNLAAAAVAGDAVRYEQAILTSGVNAFAAAQSFGGFRATNLADPSASQDAVTLAYMNARLNGLTPKAPVKAASTANLTLSGTQTVDTVALVAGDRVLVKNQTNAPDNGIYVVASGAWARSADMDSLTPIDEFNGAWVTVQQGSQAGQVFVEYGTVTTVGTDPINFAFYNPIAGLIGGDMITFSGSTFSVDLATSSGLKSTNPGNVAGQLTINLEASNPSLQITGLNELAVKLAAGGAIGQGASGLAVNVDASTIEINANALRVKDLGITLAKLAANSVDENKIVSTTYDAAGAITGGSGTKVKANVDGTSLEISSNAIRVKSTAYDQATITGGSGSAAAVQYAPSLKQSFVAGEAMAANTTFLVRMAMFDLGETVGRVYKADKDASSDNKWVVIGWVNSSSAVSAGGSVTVNLVGTSAPGSFGNSNIGREVFLGSAGAQVLGASLANTTNEAQIAVGVVTGLGAFLFTGPQFRGIA
jgi:hypothetical protein